MLLRVSIVYKPKNQIWCESDVPCAQDPSIPVWFISEVPDPVNHYSLFSITKGIWLKEAYLQSLKSISLWVRTQSWLLRTDRRTHLESQINISRCYARVDKTNLPSMKRLSKSSTKAFSSLLILQIYFWFNFIIMPLMYFSFEIPCFLLRQVNRIATIHDASPCLCNLRRL